MVNKNSYHLSENSYGENIWINVYSKFKERFCLSALGGMKWFSFLAGQGRGVWLGSWEVSEVTNKKVM